MVNKSGIIIECIQGDISYQPGIDAVVNAANRHLKPGGGVAGAIHRAAGPGLQIECRDLAPIDPGQAVITSAHKLPNKYIIHCLGPVYGIDKPHDRILAECYVNALKRGEEKRISSVAFPAISTGIFGYPVTEAAMVAFNAIGGELRDLEHIRHIRFVLYSISDLQIHKMVMEKELK